MIRIIQIYLLGTILMFGQEMREIDQNPQLVDDLSIEQIEDLIDIMSKFRYRLDITALPDSVTQILYDRRPELTEKINLEIAKGKSKYQDGSKTNPYGVKRIKTLYSRAEIEKTGLKKKIVKDLMKDFKGDIKKALINYSYTINKSFPEVYSAARSLGYPQSQIIEYKNNYNKRLAARRAKRASTWTAIAAGVAQGAASYASSYSSNNTQKSTYVASPATSRQYLKSQGQVAPSSSKNSYTSLDNGSNNNSTFYSNANATYTDQYGMTTGSTSVQENLNGGLTATHKDQYGMTTGYSNTNSNLNGNITVTNTDSYGMTTGYSEVNKTYNGEYTQTHKNVYGMNTGYSETKTYDGYKLITHKDQYGMIKGYTKVFNNGNFETTNPYGMIISKGKID